MRKTSNKIMCFSLVFIMMLTATVFAVEPCDYYSDGHHRVETNSYFLDKERVAGTDTIYNIEKGCYEEKDFYFYIYHYRDITCCKCGWYGYSERTYEIYSSKTYLN
ncbi:hypothetical protein JYG23_09685 [Sedimentibacter sp. zth1]|uniref:hypothetical protein n=1 Tax=Sedimentibacter sp. zth1 TaxID=2816908 RepID=UPI001A914BB8|nr:hypothetical protein [Sedimentibacter sp. zth1]QSX04960.1 hypothetical protein JYG23_09685 [Sedimentibacter sp. zth1]